MLRLFEKYRPRSLADIVGQPDVYQLQVLARDPYPCCVLMTGPGGVGKTASALAFAAELGCNDEWTDRHVVNGTDLTIDNCKELWRGVLQFRAKSSSGFKVLIIEELEWLSQQAQVFLKDGLERKLPPNTLVLATSNGTDKLSKPLLQRFKKLAFRGDREFAAAAAARLRRIWLAETGLPSPPSGYELWGWDGDTYSLRVALDTLQERMALCQPAVA